MQMTVDDWTEQPRQEDSQVGVEEEELMGKKGWLVPREMRP